MIKYHSIFNMGFVGREDCYRQHGSSWVFIPIRTILSMDIL